MRKLLLVGIALVGSSVVAEGRMWTDITGAHRLDAQFVSLAEGKVRLQTAGGRSFSVALDQLSPADRQLVLDEDRNLQRPESPGADSLGTPQTLTAALQSTQPDGPAARQNPAPLPLELPLQTLPPPGAAMPSALPGTSMQGQSPMGQSEGQPGSQGQPQSATQSRGDSSKDKRIFSGCRSTFHLDSRDGTAAYWVGGKHYLGKLAWFRTEGNYVYFTGTGEGGVQAWAFFDVQSASGNRIYAWMTGRNGWQPFDDDGREVPN